MTRFVQFHSLEYEDKRPVAINVEWIKAVVVNERDETIIIVGDGNTVATVPAEMYVVQESYDQVLEVLHYAGAY